MSWSRPDAPGRRRRRPRRRRPRAAAGCRRHGGGASRTAPARPRRASGTNHCYTATMPCGDYAAAKAKADVVVKRRFINQRLIPNTMEPRAVVAAPSVGMADEIAVWTSTQIPHVLRVVLALLTGVPENNIRVIAPDVGGGFGVKLQIYREEVLGAPARQEARPSGEVGRDAQRAHGRLAPRPRPDPGHRDRRHERRHASSAST
ncbi:MAG: molybdopterin cofactor-binding domain-containing protein [Candidatus Nanopelagicales bacterium]